MSTVIEFIIGVCFICIAPIVLLKTANIESETRNALKQRGYFLYELTMINAISFFLFYQNTEIIMGFILGSCLFRLLIIGGVQKLIFSKSKRLIKGQYLVFSMILVLFLSADYLLAGKNIMNCINRIDAVLLIFVALLYIYFIYGREWMEQARATREVKQKGKADGRQEEDVNTLKKYDIKRTIPFYVLIECSLLVGMYFFAKNVPIAGAAYGIPQYRLGLTIVSWCISFSGIFLSLVEKKQAAFLENAMEQTILLITLGIGMVALLRPIMVSQFIIYDLMIFSVVALLLQFSEKAVDRFAGSAMITAYIGFIVYACIR